MMRYVSDVREFNSIKPEVIFTLGNKAAIEIREACQQNEIAKEIKKKKLTRKLAKAKGKLK